MKILGIYKIESKTSGKYYIGSTINMKSRWSRHKSDLRKNKHHSIILQRAWNKYGESDFEFEILEECKIENLLKREQFYLTSLLPIYNISPNAGNCVGVKHTLESSEKKRKYAIDNNIRPPRETWEKKQIKVNALDSEGKVVNSFPSLAEACRFVGRNHTYVSTITRAIKRNIKAYGYKWSYV